MDNRLLLTNRKTKRLKTLLGRQRAFRGERVPFIAPLVFLSHPELDCRLDAGAGMESRVWGATATQRRRSAGVCPESLTSSLE